MNYFSIDGPLNEWIVLFHGTGGNEFSLLQIAGDIEPNANILSCIGTVGSGEGRRFFAQLENGKLERKDFNERVEEFLMTWQQMKPTNAEKITFLGYSNGANFILGILEKAPKIADCLVLMHPSNLGYTFEEGSDVSIHITAGSMDTLANAGDTMKLSKQLEQQFPNTILKLVDGGHEVRDGEIDYLRKVLK